MKNTLKDHDLRCNDSGTCRNSLREPIDNYNNNQYCPGRVAN